MWPVNETNLILKPIVSNTAIDLVRRTEFELERSLVRPERYPAAKHPAWRLPALLLYKDADLEPLPRTVPLRISLCLRNSY
ncbi:hypothetical protein EJ02DRAFT_163128 [Clathrospora elynae]|uniref:Uncharacterized protein n=1 Tax=Clathrospora elynae TaxID=706981 RepID=A0A6A5SSQ6_9PLEO|nr:hypothetical protein EJ02DRAFT_163128 [Clathrospora elynae]